MSNFSEISIHELRKLATSEYGVKSVAKYRKEALVALLDSIVADRAAEAEAQAKETAKAVKAASKKAEKAAMTEVKSIVSNGRKTCIICGKRPGMNAAQLRNQGIGDEFADQCEPCHIEAGWENTHSDYGHDAILDGTFKPEGGQAEMIAGDMEHCWICHPELNKASAEYVARAGSSRLGMVLEVPVRAAGETKAATVIEKVKGLQGVTTEVKISKKDKTVTLFIDSTEFSIQLVWAITGAYLYNLTSLETKGNGQGVKVRNVSAALRYLGLKG